jgi:hypothetical protein
VRVARIVCRRLQSLAIAAELNQLKSTMIDMKQQMTAVAAAPTSSPSVVIATVLQALQMDAAVQTHDRCTASIAIQTPDIEPCPACPQWQRQLHAKDRRIHLLEAKVRRFEDRDEAERLERQQSIRGSPRVIEFHRGAYDGPANDAINSPRKTPVISGDSPVSVPPDVGSVGIIDEEEFADECWPPASGTATDQEDAAYLEVHGPLSASADEGDGVAHVFLDEVGKSGSESSSTSTPTRVMDEPVGADEVRVDATPKGQSGAAVDAIEGVHMDESMDEKPPHPRGSSTSSHILDGLHAAEPSAHVMPSDSSRATA